MTLRQHSFLPQLLPCLLLAGTALAASGQPICDSDGAPAPAALVEHFIPDRCGDCWRGTPAPAAPGVLALDWVVPSGDDQAPLAAAAMPEATQRMQRLGLPADARPRSRRTDVIQPARQGWIRLSHGPASDGYLGVAFGWKPAAGDLRTLDAWVLLVEELPAGAADSPAPRRLVRGAWTVPGISGHQREWTERRAMRVPDGADPARLRLVGWLVDRHGVVSIAAATRCPATAPGR